MLTYSSQLMLSFFHISLSISAAVVTLKASPMTLFPLSYVQCAVFSSQLFLALWLYLFPR